MPRDKTTDKGGSKNKQKPLKDSIPKDMKDDSRGKGAEYRNNTKYFVPPAKIPSVAL